MTALAEAHIRAQARLRALTATAAGKVWASLAGYDEENLDEWVTRVVPVILAAQRQSALLTDGFVARSVGRRPFGVDPDQVVGRAARRGAALELVYRRPFVTVWTSLADGVRPQEAVARGASRTAMTAQTDVQLAMRETLSEIAAADSRISYRRLPNAHACELCKAAKKQHYARGQVMPIHPGCGCGVTVVAHEAAPARPAPVIEGADVTVAVREHGELGPMLVNAAHEFTELEDDRQ